MEFDTIHSASEMTYIVSGGALNSFSLTDTTHTARQAFE